MRPDFIETHTGRSFRPLAPVVADIDIRDIAHALSHQCRFSGHVRQHYSVAEHSVRVSELLEKWSAPKWILLWGLLHDASEAYLVDIPSPLKSTPVFELYRAAEKQLMQAVCERFGLPIEEPSQVGTADGVLVATEARDLMPYHAPHWIGLREAPLPETIKPWHSATAKREFLSRFEELTK